MKGRKGRKALSVEVQRPVSALQLKAVPARGLEVEAELLYSVWWSHHWDPGEAPAVTWQILR